VYLALGPTASVLALDLHKAGIQALDLGHLSMFYINTRKKNTRYRVIRQDELDALMKKAGVETLDYKKWKHGMAGDSVYEKNQPC